MHLHPYLEYAVSDYFWTKLVSLTILDLMGRPLRFNNWKFSRNFELLSVTCSFDRGIHIFSTHNLWSPILIILIGLVLRLFSNELFVDKTVSLIFIYEFGSYFFTVEYFWYFYLDVRSYFSLLYSELRSGLVINICDV